jgi:hypothetical protein
VQSVRVELQLNGRHEPRFPSTVAYELRGELVVMSMSWAMRLQLCTDRSKKRRTWSPTVFTDGPMTMKT